VIFSLDVGSFQQQQHQEQQQQQQQQQQQRESNRPTYSTTDMLSEELTEEKLRGAKLLNFRYNMHTAGLGPLGKTDSTLHVTPSDLLHDLTAATQAPYCSCDKWEGAGGAWSSAIMATNAAAKTARQRLGDKDCPRRWQTAVQFNF
jgi:hypothetical protein